MQQHPYPWEADDMRYFEIDAPLFPVMPRPLQERMRPGLLDALWRLVARGAMHRDEETAVSRATGGRI
ncbi:MAG TPA: hypothetical protein VIC57_04495 [Candidatus Dormibacteraeota bacterium]